MPLSVSCSDRKQEVKRPSSADQNLGEAVKEFQVTLIQTLRSPFLASSLTAYSGNLGGSVAAYLRATSVRILIHVLDRLFAAVNFIFQQRLQQFELVTVL